MDRSSGFGRNIEGANTVHTKCTFCGGANHSAEFFNSIRQVKEKSCAAGYSDNRQTECTPRKRFRCGSEDDLIAKFLKPPKENKKRRKQVLLMDKVIVHATMARITVTKINIHLWNV